MTDQELLELAAKAAGLVVDGTFETDTGRAWLTHWAERHGELQPLLWNPLADDGDAFRLAVKLGMNVEINDNYTLACTYGNFSEPAKPDPAAAARRAIVRAAAAVGSNGETV
ncbi:hypothetical protein [Pseudomonas fluorescens]|uniref:hypothetical protein n=1 Tax=Pseudomonas fluorescens TaxID=294 RepID=UPI00069887A1|nr:hypothetical protein [Pseudomonas fluorescens]